MFSQMAQVIKKREGLSSQQNASRSEVERDFAQHFIDPQFRQTYETVLTEDNSFRDDPHGPYKAALLARGMLADVPASEAASPAADAARRQALTGIGPSVPEGNSAPQTDRVTRYNAAIARARQTGQDRDFVEALMIKNGQL